MKNRKARKCILPEANFDRECCGDSETAPRNKAPCEFSWMPPSSGAWQGGQTKIRVRWRLLRNGSQRQDSEHFPPKAAKFLSESRSEFQTKNTYPTGAQDGQSLPRDLLRSGCSPNDRATRGRSRKAEPLPRGSFFSSPISQWRGNGCFFVAVFGEPQGVAVDGNKQSHCHGSQM